MSASIDGRRATFPVTTSTQLPSQQDLSRFPVAVLVMRARSNRLVDLQALVPQLLAVLSAVKKGEVTVIE